MDTCDLLSPLACDSWQVQWALRDYSPLRGYIVIISCALAFVTICLSVAIMVDLRRGTKRIDNEKDPNTTGNSMNTERVLKLTKGHLYVGLIYMFHVWAFHILDLVVLMWPDIAANSGTWETKQALSYIAGFVTGLALGYPVWQIAQQAQMMVLKWCLTRFEKKDLLRDTFVAAVGLSSVHAMQLWCMAALYISGWWPLLSYSMPWTMFRLILLVGCGSSACAWLDVSLLFTYKRSEVQLYATESWFEERSQEHAPVVLP